MTYKKSSLRDIQNFDDIYDMLIENGANPETRYHPASGDFAFLANFEEELEDFKTKAFEWRDSENKLAAISWPDHRGIYYICTRQANHEIYEIILEDIESGLPVGKEIWLWNCDTDKARQDVLKQRKYSTNGWYMFYGHKSLMDSIPAVNLPDGYAIRELVESDIPQKVDLMGISMGEMGSRTVEKYRNMQKSPVYDGRMDLIVVDDNNNLVSFING